MTMSAVKLRLTDAFKTLKRGSPDFATNTLYLLSYCPTVYLRTSIRKDRYRNSQIIIGQYDTVSMTIDFAPEFENNFEVGGRASRNAEMICWAALLLQQVC